MIASIATAFFVLAQGQDVVPTLHFSVESAKKDVLKGSLTVSIPAGWHAYQNPPKSEFENPLKLVTTTKGFKLKPISYPKGVPMKSSGMDSMVYMGDVKIPIEGKFDSTVKPEKDGRYKFEFTLSYQFCNDSTCIPPSTMTGRIFVKVAAK